MADIKGKKETERKGIAGRIRKIAERKEEPDKKKIIKKDAEKQAKKPEQPKKEALPIAEPFKTLKFVLMTEKAIQLIETQNKLVFIVRRNSTKDDIKNAAESAFKSPIKDVQTLIDQKSRKKAFIKFAKEGDAGEIAIRLGII